MIDTLTVDESIKVCMRDVVDNFEPPEAAQDAGLKSLDDVAKKADEGNEQALTLLAEFQADLDRCN